MVEVRDALLAAVSLAIANYPGPFLAKITSLYGAYHAYTGDIHLDVERCHAKYGKFVRYRPNALLVNSVEGFHDIYGNLKKIKKSKHYMIHGDNLLGLTDKTKYARIKKIFQQGFSDSANREHEPKVVKEIETYLEKISGNETQEHDDENWSCPKNMALWNNYLTTDVVCQVVFSTSWDLLTSATNRGLTEASKAIVRMVGVLHYWPHLSYHELTALIFMPHLAWSYKAIAELSQVIVDRSKAQKIKDPSVKDVYGYFSALKDPDTGDLMLTAKDVRRNSGTLIVAGSDTTASALSATFFYLTRNPEAYEKVAQEVRSTFPDPSAIRSGAALNSCVYLRAAINEALRMSPVAPQPLWREAEAGGCLVDGELIPAGLNVGAGIFTLHHNAKAFPDPYKYDIERWISGPGKDAEEEKERIKEISKGFAPFSIGPRQCIAKNFALMELSLTLANVFSRLDFESVGTLGEGKKSLGEGRDREGEFQMKAYFTGYMEGPMVKFRRRKA